MPSTAYEPSRTEIQNEEFGPEKSLLPNPRGRAPRRAPTAQGLSATRVAIRVISLVVAVSLISILGHAAAVWIATKDVVQKDPSTGYQLRAWAANLDMWPTWTMLGAAAIALVIQVVSLLTLCSVTQRLRESNWHNWGVFLSSALAISAWIAAVVYFKIQDTKGKLSWDLWSWSCSHTSLENGKMSFETICIEMNYTFLAGIVVAVLEIASLGIFFVHLRAGPSRYRKLGNRR